MVQILRVQAGPQSGPEYKVALTIQLARSTLSSTWWLVRPLRPTRLIPLRNVWTFGQRKKGPICGTLPTYLTGWITSNAECMSKVTHTACNCNWIEQGSAQDDAGHFISTSMKVLCDLDNFWGAHVLHEEITSPGYWHGALLPCNTNANHPP